MIFNPLKPYRAQSLQEYSLVIGLVVLVSIGIIGLLGQNISDTMATAIGAGNPGGTGGTANPTNLVAANTPNTPLVQAPLSLYGKTVEIALPNGKSIQMPMPNAETIMETSGPNGVTNAYLASIDNMLSQLTQNDGDPQVIQALSNLSQLGHNVGKSQTMVEAGINEVLLGLQGSSVASNSLATKVSNLSGRARQVNCTGGCNTDFDTMTDASQVRLTPNLAATAESVSTGSTTTSTLETFLQRTFDTRKTLQQQGYDALNPMLDYFSNQIYSSAKVSYTSADQLIQMNRTGAMISPQGVVSDNARSYKSESNWHLSEYNANSICDMSKAATCFNKDGSPVPKSQAIIAPADIRGGPSIQHDSGAILTPNQPEPQTVATP